MSRIEEARPPSKTAETSLVWELCPAEQLPDPIPIDITGVQTR
jgi:hypothetical protein